MRNRMLFLIAAIVGFLPLLIGAAAIAGVPMATQCQFVDINGSASGYSMAVLPDADGNWPVWNSNALKWEWRYGLSGPTNTISQVDILTPVCNPPLTITPTPYPAGDGDPSTKFGWWTGNFNVVRITPNSNSSPSLFTITTDAVLPSRNTSMWMKSGKAEYACKSIAGPECPDCPGLPFLPSTITQCMQVEGHNLMMVRNQNRCITDVYDCGLNDPNGNPGNQFCADYTTTCDRVEPNVTVTVTADPGSSAKTQVGITVGDILGNQICPEGILFSASSPGCVNVRTLSGWVQVCK